MPYFSASGSGPDGESHANSDEPQSEDPRQSLQVKLQVRQRVIEMIENRLAAKPDDKHQRFILQEHILARDVLSAELRRLNLAQDLRYQDLDAFVNDYVQLLSADAPQVRAATVPSEAVAGQIKELKHELKTWQEMIEKVRARMQKRPGDPLLMRLLGEHQARQLAVQHSLNQLINGDDNSEGSDASLVLEQVEAKLGGAGDLSPPVATGASPEAAGSACLPDAETRQPEPIAQNPELFSLQKELEIFSGMVEKTRQRLANKPELLHLRALIQQHETRIQEIRARIVTLRSDSEGG
ncbi:MAG: hypothetical protein CVV27_00275 [Candidatus Melainabacteria bacterium HGW-Melainabacteria-1]|nr:MAG: hypothetical protein CVV27_00275 [Candidatus Melainabacteria bacterium HGW-Melainabacteria-1]